jgi:hypothetical protein
MRCIDNQRDPNMSSGWSFTDKIGTVFCYNIAGLSEFLNKKRKIKMSETWNKKERERNKQQKKKEKIERRQERKLANKGSHDLESMLAYVDENGNLSSKPVDPKRK